MDRETKERWNVRWKIALFALMAAGFSFAMAGPGMMPRSGGGGGIGLPLLEIAVGVLLGGVLYWWREVRGKKEKPK